MSEKEIADKVRGVFSPYLAQRWHRAANLWERVSQRWQPTLQTLLPLGGHSDGNKITLYTHGDDAFGAKWDAIQKAKEKVWWSAYTVEPDRVGKRTVELLTQAKRRGCDVILLYDSIGSRSVDNEFLAPLRKAGALLFWFLLLMPLRAACLEFGPSWRHGPFRNHQKLLIVDDHGYCGGMNVSEDYAGLKTFGKETFSDTHIKMEGPAVKDLETVFLNSLIANQEHIPIEEIDRVEQIVERRPDLPPTPDGVFVQVLQSNIRRQRKDVQAALRLALRSATDSCYLSSPYFLPPRNIKRAIIRAARNGSDVRIITAGDSDIPFIRAAQQHIYSSFLKRGIKIYEMWDKKLHAKMASIDGIYSYVGSFNLDAWSSRNLEVNVTVLDPPLAHQLEDRFEELIARSCKEVSLDELEGRGLWEKNYHWLAYQFFTVTGPRVIDEDDDDDDDDD
ncbi:phospholipase D, putative [Acanthamoeba castellanii str. Neff]|uniref:Phospholipase D, putative n=1 Tax=Acanthamoeba castellanii (strain ATCC 30010 / Neff) TaxID=1257118 RepID=L8GD73_ACACF|nr:phospholipase D, putative [Acanthamoeba castellanii str. Neff]ELR10809.1 phospholipase D, putative [Acanthamoeba castellanii str. Neff]